MKKVVSIIVTAMLVFVLSANVWAVTDKMRETANRATDCFDRQDYDCARKGYESLLKMKMGKEQTISVKKMLRSTYFDLVKKDAENERYPKSVETYCLKGIRMGDELKMDYDEEDVAFHVWLTLYYFENGKKAETKKYIGKLKTMRDSIKGGSAVDEAKRNWIGQVVSALESRI
ncbi:MAG: hypothetical protein V2I97_12835 [Desulfococcaceae bacterium]|jgi:hypothetical protein|nr:hypothetical protein [Desulfococcaceae bacterium]